MVNRWGWYLMQVGAWVFLYLLPYLFSFEGLPNIFTIFSNTGDYLHVISFIFLVIFFYANHLKLIPLFYFRKKYASYMLILAACFWIIIYLPVNLLPKRFSQRQGPPDLTNEFRPGPPGEMDHDRPPQFGHRSTPPPFLFGKNYIILLFIVSAFASVSIHTRKRLLKAEKEKLNAELSLLKAQINPHFLFNTLNSIYALAINKDDKAADAIVHLSEIMRYTLKHSESDVIDLDKELEYIKNYIALQEARLGDTVNIKHSINGNTAGKKIAPLLLITFIENAFKHGVNPDEPSEIIIDIAIDKTSLKLFVKNRQVSSVKEEGGIGLQNIKDRLQLLYPLKHSLSLNDTAESYSVDLVINL